MKTTRIRVWAAIAAAAVLASMSESRASGVCEREIESAARRHGVPVAILYSVGLTETGNRGSLHPFALNIEGKAVFAPNRAAALDVFRAARAKGMKLIDLGCMQINHHFHGDRFASVEDMFDPARNVDYAAEFLSALHAEHTSWSMAVARYHAGPDNNPAQKRYICKVIANMVAVNHGNWTANAKAFCQ